MTSNDRDQQGKPRELAGPEGAHFYAGPDRRKPRKRGDAEYRGVERRGNPEYKLSHRSQRDFPEAYDTVSTTFWEGLSQDQVDAVMRLQAVAMEKAGFEKGAPKMFIEDFDPSDPTAHSTQPSYGQLGASTQTIPDGLRSRLLIGGVLIGMGSLSVFLAITGMLAPILVISSIGGVALIVGSVMAMTVNQS